jgi:hypothetical protein
MRQLGNYFLNSLVIVEDVLIFKRLDLLKCFYNIFIQLFLLFRRFLETLFHIKIVAYIFKEIISYSLYLFFSLFSNFDNLLLNHYIF